MTEERTAVGWKAYPYSPCGSLPTGCHRHSPSGASRIDGQTSRRLLPIFR